MTSAGGSTFSNCTWVIFTPEPNSSSAVCISFSTSVSVIWRACVSSGWMFERLGKVLGAGAATKALIVVLTTALFAAAHYPDQGLPGVQQAAIVGLVYAATYAATGKLWSVMCMHAAFDLTALAMIYFDVEAKKSILSRIQRLLRSDGYLFLGGAETTMNLDGSFARQQYDRAGCYRLKSAVAA